MLGYGDPMLENIKGFLFFSLLGVNAILGSVIDKYFC